MIAGTVVLVLCAATAAIAYWRYQMHSRTVVAQLAHSGRVVETACGPIEYIVSGDGPAVLSIHGAATGYDQGLVLGKFVPGYTCIAVSRPGHLRTPLATGATPEAQADAYAALLDTLQLAKVAVICISAGAPSAVQFALRYPERCWALVIVSGVSKRIYPLTFALQIIYRMLLVSDFVPWLLRSIAPNGS
jgi:2-hydroxy-6-oxonona-2,4-dienedioate hydrolase